MLKKDGRLRLVLDCRIVNRRFGKSSKVRMASGAKWADFEIGSGDELFVAQSDIKNFFYALGIHESLGRFFFLTPRFDQVSQNVEPPL